MLKHAREVTVLSPLISGGNTAQIKNNSHYVKYDILCLSVCFL